VIAETMFRHDAKAMLYAPLRMLIYSDADGDAVFTRTSPARPSAVSALPTWPPSARIWTAKW